MTTQEIADYLEEKGYPMNSINNVSSNTCIIYTGVKGGYLFQAALIQMLYEKDIITKEFLNSIVKKRKEGYEEI